MIALSLSNVSLLLGARPIFLNLFWEIQDDQRIGLIGPNGAGKSSLFKLMVGEHVAEPGGDSGAVVRVAVMMVSGIVSMVYFIRSFIAVRKARTKTE